ncbi:integrase-like protein [Thermosporothrix hazakensis]|uniref:Integrase-like protein n=1 Tax=Thermosporothrix hazakensis TaxID=644383 RepID=A0A326TWL7_THEHA|nr:integrase core domain-containing protein [Thermosporothrix hazakensis]PZW20549.1 integrase-like protein [Thermosporothrix hazakensis]
MSEAILFSVCLVLSLVFLLVGIGGMIYILVKERGEHVQGRRRTLFWVPLLLQLVLLVVHVAFLVVLFIYPSREWLCFLFLVLFLVHRLTAWQVAQFPPVSLSHSLRIACLALAWFSILTGIALYVNPFIESFWATLKKECLYREALMSKKQVRQTIFSSVEGFYLHHRRQSALGYLTPAQLEAFMT